MNEALVVLVRSLIGFFTLLIFARMLGKQQISQLTFFDYVLGITIGSIAATLSVDLSSRAWPHWIGLLTWSITVFILQWATQKFFVLDKYFNGEPTIVIADGKIMEESMKKIRYTITDLLEQLRAKEVFDFTQVAYAVLETDGQLSVLLKAENQPVSRADLKIPSPQNDISTELIIDGVVVTRNLEKRSLDRTWMDKELKKRGLASPRQVYLMTISDSGTVYVDLYEDHKQ